MFTLNVHSFLLTVLCALLAEKGLAIPAPAHFYPYGTDNDDSMVPPGERRSKMYVSRDFPYRGKQAHYVKVYTYGRVDLPRSGTYIDVFKTDIDTTKNDGRIYYRQTTDNRILQRGTNDVRRYFSDASTFSADWVFIASYHSVTYENGNSTSPVATFQVVLITDGVQSYAMLNYGDIQFAKDPEEDDYANVRFDHYDLPDDEKASVSDIELTTNVGKLGRWMFRVDGIPLVPGSIFNQDVYDCDDNSPCTAANRALGKYKFAYVDMSKYLQCDVWGHCFDRPCAPGTIFKASISECVQAQ
ncbi:Sushi, nidogen and EGF-like domain-containing protein 1 [Lamellibrachia satsuma]|nr:Sushi, nidogen and EGF-like domain-containing protein 1 [Lamellibrachia satsuma]